MDFDQICPISQIYILTHEGKAILLHAWTGSEGSRRLRLPDFKIINTWSDKVVSSMHLQVLPSSKHSWYSFLLKVNPLPLLFKALLYGQKDCIFFSGHLNVQETNSALERLGRHRTFKSQALWSVRDVKGLSQSQDHRATGRIVSILTPKKTN
jgi:hypothetical protein